MELGNIILNVLLVSIPEELFITVMALILMRRADFLDKLYLKKNIVGILTMVVVPCAVFFNLTLNFIGTTWNLPLNIIFFTTCLCILLKTKKFFKVIIFATLSMIIGSILQLIISLVLVYMLHLDFKQILEDPILKFKLFLPERILEIGIMTFFFIKSNSSKEKISIFKCILNNKSLKYIIGGSLILDIALMIYALNNFILSESLDNMEFTSQTAIMISMMGVVILNMIIPWIVAYSVYSSENKLLNTQGGRKNEQN